jgi:hypothetical protein
MARGKTEKRANGANLVDELPHTAGTQAAMRKEYATDNGNGGKAKGDISIL